MKNNASIFKKVRLFRDYKKIIKENTVELSQKFGIRVDNAWRLYTVLNIPEEIIGESYSLKKQDVDRISENFIAQYGQELANYLNSKGLNELYKYYEIQKVDKYSYLLVFGFSLLQTDKYYKNLYYRVTPISLITILTILFFLIF